MPCMSARCALTRAANSAHASLTSGATSTLCTPALRLAYATTAVTAPRMSASEVQRPLSCASDAAPPETAPESSASFSARYRSFDAHLRGGRNECGETQRDRDSAREQEKT